MERINFKPEAEAAATAVREYLAQRRQILGNVKLTPEQKDSLLAEYRSRYNAFIQSLQEDVQRGALRRQSELPGRMRTAQAWKAERLAQVLGNGGGARFELISRWVDKTPLSRLSELAAEQPDDFGKAAVLELAAVRLGDDDSPEAEQARRGLLEVEADTLWGASVAKLKAEDAELRNIRPFIESLDVMATREVWADRLGQSSDIHIPDEEYLP